jgi:hypothetical protein
MTSIPNHPATGDAGMEKDDTQIDRAGPHGRKRYRRSFANSWRGERAV